MVDQEVSKGNFPLILGGDHSIAIGSLAGIAKHYDNLGVIWYDAHGDLNSDKTSPTGNIHGMPLAASLGIGHELCLFMKGWHTLILHKLYLFMKGRPTLLLHRLYNISIWWWKKLLFWLKGHTFPLLSMIG